MSAASLVYVSTRTWFYHRAGTAVYHRKGRHEFPTYVLDEEATARVGYPAAKPVGAERGWTACGRLTEAQEERAHKPPDTYRHKYMDAVRLDIAEAIGRPCRQCLGAQLP